MLIPKIFIHINQAWQPHSTVDLTNIHNITQGTYDNPRNINFSAYLWRS